MAPVTLDIQPLTDAFLSEDVMASPYSFSESQAQQELAEVFKADVSVRTAA